MLLLAAFAATVLWLRYIALPNVEDYRATIVASLEKASGMAVGIRGLQGGWDGLRPTLSLEGFALRDRAGKAALAFERAEVTVSWWSLLRGELLIHRAELLAPRLDLRRGTDGLVYLGDKALDAARPGDEGQFTRWILAQPRLQVLDAVLVWRDEMTGANPVQLTGVDINVRRDGRRHRAALVAIPPAHLARRIELRADVVLRHEGDRWRAEGDLFGEARDADLARLREHLPVPETLRSGAGNLRVWLAVGSGGLREATADLQLRDGRAQLAADVLPLELATLSGRATWKLQPGGYSLSTQGLRFRTASGLEAQPGRFSVSFGQVAGAPPKGEVKADGIDLKIAAALMVYFPVPRDVKDQVLRFAPRGSLSHAAFAWTGPSPAQASAWQVAGRFADLAVNAVAPYPGVSGLTGSLEGTERGGTVQLSSKQATLEVAHLFRAPLAFQQLEARATWKPAGRALEVAIAEARLANADLEARVEGTWRSLPDAPEKSPGFVALRGTVARLDVAKAAHYMPNRIAETRAWMDRAILAGRVSDGRFELQGDLWHFPFADASRGRFVAEGRLQEVQLKYHPAWPSVDRLAGSLRFDNARIELRASDAAIFASRVREAIAVVPNVLEKPPILTLTGTVDSAGGDAARFLRESPLIEGPGAFTRAVAVEGPGRLALKLEFPFYGEQRARLQGEYIFAGATAALGRTLAITALKGRLQFTEQSVRANELTGMVFGHPATLRLASQPDNTVVTTLEGRIARDVLGAYVPENFAARLDGAFDWKARAVSGRDGTTLRIESDLRGLASGLPEPFAKLAAEARPLTIAIANLGTDQETTMASLGDGAHGRFVTRGSEEGRRWFATLRFGKAGVDDPVREGIWLLGELPLLDLDAWQGLFAPRSDGGSPDARALAPELRGIDLQLGQLRYTGRTFPNLAARLERQGAQWSGRLEGPAVAGDVQWNPMGRGRVRARLARLALGPAAEGPVTVEAPAQAAELPELDIVAERFHFRDRELGRLELKAEPEGGTWRIHRLDIGNGHAQLKSNGVWRPTATGSLTTLDMALDSSNLNALFAQFGFGDHLKRGTGKLEGQLVWPGMPNDFAVANLSGSFKVEATRGQFAKIEPGAGKLLGLLSLQSIPRRATLDFRDVFSDGFAFESIAGSVKLARGILLTDDFEIKGPSAFVSLAGEVSLPRETQSLTLKVVPEVGEGLALAATVLGTPILGLSTLLVSKLLQNPLGKAVAYEYLVTGSWDNPNVTRLGAPALPKAAAAAQSTP